MNRRFLLLLIPLLLLPATAPAQKKKKRTTDEGMLPVVISEDKKKKKKEEETQTLPPPKELPTAVAGEADRLVFQVSPLSAKGLLSQQTREALHALQQRSHSATIIKLRAFVAGSGDMRRIGELVGELWSDKRLPLPALSVVQAGALPLEGAQVVIESTAAEKKAVNPNGVTFLSAHAGDTLEQSVAALSGDLHAAGLEDSDMLRVTCFVRSLDENKDAGQRLGARFPGAAANYVQMQREYTLPVAACEGVARRRTPGRDAASRLVFTGTQLAFGTQDNDIRLAFERLQKSLAPFNSSLQAVLASHVYLISRPLGDKVRTVGAEFYGRPAPPATTMLPFEGLPSLDASFGLDVVTRAGSAAAVPQQ